MTFGDFNIPHQRGYFDIIIMSAITRSGACLRLGAPGNLRDPADGSQESFSNRGQLVKSSKDLTCRYWRLDPDRCSGLSCPYSHSWTGTMSRPLPYTCARWEAGTCHSSQDLCLYTHGKTTAIPTAPRAMHGHGKFLLFCPFHFIGTRVHDSGNPT